MNILGASWLKLTVFKVFVTLNFKILPCRQCDSITRLLLKFLFNTVNNYNNTKETFVVKDLIYHGFRNYLHERSLLGNRWLIPNYWGLGEIGGDWFFIGKGGLNPICLLWCQWSEGWSIWMWDGRYG